MWNGLVILQVDTQADSFLLALKADTGETVWKTDRDELPSWGTPTVAMTPAGPELVTNASKFVRGYDPRTRQGAVAARRQLEDHRADADLRRRPVHRRQRPRARAADLRHQARRARRSHAQERRDEQRRGRLEQHGARVVHADAARARRRALRPGQQWRLRRLRPADWTGDLPAAARPVGSGFSASPVVADGKIYLSSEDGEILVVAAGRRSSRSRPTRWATC